MANPNFPGASSQKVSNLWNADYALADEGSYFVGANAWTAANTGIVITASIADDALPAGATSAPNSPSMIIYNAENANNPNAVSIYPRYCKVTTKVIPLTTVTWYYAWRLDNTNRYASGGTALTMNNVNPGSTRGTKSAVTFGVLAVTSTTVSSANRLVSNGSLAGAAPVVLDTYLWQFGAPGLAMDSARLATVKSMTIQAPPVVIPPGWSLQLELWGATYGATGAQYDVEWGHVERTPGL
jgi:hypothetical protein